MTSGDIVRHDEAPHVWFHRRLRTLTCDQCGAQESIGLLETHADRRILAFAERHWKCGPSQDDSAMLIAGLLAPRAERS